MEGKASKRIPQKEASIHLKTIIEWLDAFLSVWVQLSLDELRTLPYSFFHSKAPKNVFAMEWSNYSRQAFQFRLFSVQL